MKIEIFNLDDISHTRLIKWIGNHLLSNSYTLKKVGPPSANNYILKLDPKINSRALISHLISLRVDFDVLNEGVKSRNQIVLENMIRTEVRKQINEETTLKENEYFGVERRRGNIHEPISFYKKLTDAKDLKSRLEKGTPPSQGERYVIKIYKQERPGWWISSRE